MWETKVQKICSIRPPSKCCKSKADREQIFIHKEKGLGGPERETSVPTDEPLVVLNYHTHHMATMQAGKMDRATKCQNR